MCGDAAVARDAQRPAGRPKRKTEGETAKAVTLVGGLTGAVKG
ncbi:hypothetical protein J2S41_006521 [Catenuloplanes atrovinosus]|uniref:Uncharacterized protein n=1 Tax=Catenuloplanes atrovinosus TaxID=137266 RepID=A0AAE3YTP8_9ACTN|nr:hypothetical protein [Catenuloplanes atrovinosus]